MMSFLAKLMQPKRMVADKDLQGCFIEWEKELALYHKLTNKTALDEDQHKMHLMNMCSAALQTHLLYREPIHKSEMAGIRREITDYLNKAADNAAARSKSGRMAALEDAASENEAKKIGKVST